MSDTPETSPSDAISLSSYLTAALLAVLPPLFANGYTSYEGFRRGVFVILACLALFLWGLETVRSRRMTVAAWRPLAVAVSFGAYALCAIAWSDVALFGALEATYMGALAIVTWIVCAPSGRAPRFSLYGLMLSIGVVGAGISGLLDLAGVSLFTMVWDPPGITGVFGAEEFAAAYYTVALPLAAAFFMGTSEPSRFAGLIAILIGGFHYTCVTTFQDAAVMLAAAAVGAALVASKRQDKGIKPALMVCGIVGTLAIGGALMSPENFAGRGVQWAVDIPVVDARSIETSTRASNGRPKRNPIFATDRIETVRDLTTWNHVIARALDTVADRPAVGEGAGGWWLTQTRHGSLDETTPKPFTHYAAFRAPHNAPAKIATEYGLLGLALWGLWCIAALVIAIASARAPIEAHEDPDGHLRAEALGVAVACVAATLIAQTTALLSVPVAASCAAMVFALAARGAYERGALEALAGALELGGEDNRGQVFLPALAAVLGAAAMVTPHCFELYAGYVKGQADQFMLYENYTGAADLYEQADGILPAHAEVAFNWALARARTEGSRPEGSREPLDIALSRRPDDARILTLGAQMNLGLDRYEEAAKLATLALEKAPSLLDAHTAQSMAYVGMKEYERAAKVYVKVLKMDLPKSKEEEIRMRVAGLYEGFAQQPRLALEQYEAIVEMSEEDLFLSQAKERIPELEKRIKRERLEREGKEVPPELMPKEPPTAPGWEGLKGEPRHSHDHDHGHGHAHPH